MPVNFAAAVVTDTGPLCNMAHFVSGNWYFLGDSRTVAVDNLLDFSSFITEICWVTDIH